MAQKRSDPQQVRRRDHRAPAEEVHAPAPEEARGGGQGRRRAWRDGLHDGPTLGVLPAARASARHGRVRPRLLVRGVRAFRAQRPQPLRIGRLPGLHARRVEEEVQRQPDGGRHGHLNARFRHSPQGQGPDGRIESQINQKKY